MIIISDIHGCYKTLLALLSKLPKGEKICISGDLIDRGPQSLEVIEYIIENKIDCVRGNHDHMMTSPESEDLWFKNGGGVTYEQYKGKEELFKKHVAWIKSLPYYLEYKDIKTPDGKHLIVSHAAITSLDFDDLIKSMEIMWNRSVPIKTSEWFNVFGHTPSEEPVITDWFACIDTGCVYKTVPGLGKLTALRFPQMEIYQQENIDV